VATSTALIVIAGMAVVTFLTRVPLVLLAARRLRLPRALDHVLEQIPIAAFAAIVFPAVLQPHGETDITASNLYLYAAAATVAVALVVRRGILVPIVVGVTVAIALRGLT